MKKLMVAIGAAAAAFGVYAATTATSFEAVDAGCSEGVFDAATAGWTAGENDTLNLKAYDGDAYTYGTGSKARRSGSFIGTTDNDQYLNIETDTGSALSHVIDAGNLCIDQLVKFTGFEEDPTLAEGAKVAVWMKAVDNDVVEGEEVPGATNLYVTVARQVDATFEQVNVKLAGNYATEKWYRLSVKFIDGILNSVGVNDLGGQRGGFVVYIDGEPVTIASDEDPLILDPSVTLTPKAAELNANGQLLPSIMAATSIASVSYQGIGAIDDLIIDEEGPEFMADANVEVTLTVPTGVQIVKVMVGTEEIVPVDGKYSVPKDASLVVTLTNDGAYVLSTTEVTVTVGEAGTIDLSDKVEPIPAIAQIGEEDPIYFADVAEALEAAEEIEGGAEVYILEDEAEASYDELLLVFAKDSIVRVNADANWEIEGGVTMSGTLADKTITIADGDITVGEDKITLGEDGVLVVGVNPLTIADAFTTPAEGKEVKETVDAEAGTYTYQLGNKEDEKKEAKIGTVFFVTLQDAVDSSEEGDIVVLTDVTLAARVEVSRDVVIDLGKFTITPTATCGNGSAFDIKAGNVTIKNGTIDGTALTQTAEDRYNKECDAITVRSGATVTCEDLTIAIDSITGSCVYPFDGATATIKSGTYTNAATVTGPDNELGMCFNQANVATQLVFVEGGAMSKDPAAGDNSAKGAKSFLGVGYKSVESEGMYTVVDDETPRTLVWAADAGSDIVATSELTVQGTTAKRTVRAQDTVVLAERGLTGDVVFIKNCAALNYVIAGDVQVGHDKYDPQNFPANSTVTVNEGATLLLRRWDNKEGQDSGAYTINVQNVTFTGAGLVKVIESQWVTAIRGPINGDATFDVSGVSLATAATLTYADTWTGTVKLGMIGKANGLNLNLGNENSKVEVPGVEGGWLAVPQGVIKCNPTLVLTGDFMINDYSPRTYAFTAIEGTGSFTLGEKTGANVLNEAEIDLINAAAFTGTVANNTGKTLTIKKIVIAEAPTAETKVVKVSGANIAVTAVYVGEATEAADLTVTVKEDGIYVAPKASPVKPVDPETPSEPYADKATAEAAAAAINENKEAMINAPDGVTKSDYVALFEAVVTTDNKVVVQLTAAAQADLQDQVNGDVKAAALVNATATEVAVTTTPGFYYTVMAGTEVGAITTAGEKTLATGTSTTLPKPALGTTTKAFYQIKVEVK